MEPDDAEYTATPHPGQSRLSDLGDYEVFDGERWRPVASLLADPENGSREGLDAQPDEAMDAATAEAADEATVGDAATAAAPDLDRAFLRDGPGGVADLTSDR